MYQGLIVAVLYLGLLHTTALGDGKPSIPFVDGRWNGGTGIDPDSEGLEECWARTTYGDGTALTLAKRGDKSWHLSLSNPGWQLPPSRRYSIIAQVDFYPRVRIAAEARSQTRLEFASLEQTSLVGLIENGHTIDLMSDGFNGKYDLEGSAKVIERVRACFPD